MTALICPRCGKYPGTTAGLCHQCGAHLPRPKEPVGDLDRTLSTGVHDETPVPRGRPAITVAILIVLAVALPVILFHYLMQWFRG